MASSRSSYPGADSGITSTEPKGVEYLQQEFARSGQAASVSAGRHAGGRDDASGNPPERSARSAAQQGSIFETTMFSLIVSAVMVAVAIAIVLTK